jgi:hypothetical protein
MYYITIIRKGANHRISDSEKHSLDESTNKLLAQVHSLFSERQLNEIDLQRKYIEINADADEFEFVIKDKPCDHKVTSI